MSENTTNNQETINNDNEANSISGKQHMKLVEFNPKYKPEDENVLFWMDESTAEYYINYKGDAVHTYLDYNKTEYAGLIPVDMLKIIDDEDIVNKVKVYEFPEPCVDRDDFKLIKCTCLLCKNITLKPYKGNEYLTRGHDYICDNCRRAILAILSNTTHVSKKDEIEIDDKKRNETR